MLILLSALLSTPGSLFRSRVVFNQNGEVRRESLLTDLKTTDPRCTPRS
jgi:hypothetical protein